jgi:hypothetical protein
MRWDSLLRRRRTQRAPSTHGRRRLPQHPCSGTPLCRRCPAVADGFYEWQKEGRRRRKTPYSFVCARCPRFAGVWSYSRTPMGQRLGVLSIRPLIARYPPRYRQTRRESARAYTYDHTRVRCTARRHVVGTPTAAYDSIWLTSIARCHRADRHVSLPAERRIQRRGGVARPRSRAACILRFETYGRRFPSLPNESGDCRVRCNQSP